MDDNTTQQCIRIKEETEEINQKSKHCSINTNDEITKSHSVSKDYSTTRNRIDNSQVSLSQGQTTTLLVQRNLELRLSNDSQTKVRSILNEVHMLTDKEKLLLYLKLPTKNNNAEDECHPIPLSNTRQEQTQAFQWIQSNLEETDSSSNLPKHEVYDDYKAYCDTLCVNRTLSAPDFGKIIKCVFPSVKARRLGTRGNSKYCYNGLRKKLIKDSPSLPEVDCVGSNSEVNNNDGTSNKVTNNQDHVLNSACTLVCEWANKLLGRVFTSVIELARFLVGGSYVSTKSMAAFVVMSATEDQKRTENRLSLQSPMSKIKIRKDSTPSPAILRSNSTDMSIDSAATSPLTPLSENASSPGSVDSRPLSSLSNNPTQSMECKPKQAEDKQIDQPLDRPVVQPTSLPVTRALTPSQLTPLPLTIQCASKRDTSPTVLMSPVFATPIGTPSRKIPMTPTSNSIPIDAGNTRSELQSDNNQSLPQSPHQRQTHTTRSPSTLKRADSSPYPIQSPRQARHTMSTSRNQTGLSTSTKSAGRNRGENVNCLSSSLPIWPAQAIAAFVNQGGPLPESPVSQQFQMTEIPLQASPVSLTNKPPTLQRHHSLPDPISLQHYQMLNNFSSGTITQPSGQEHKTSFVPRTSNQAAISPVKSSAMLRTVRDKVLNVGQFNSANRQQPAKRNLLQYFENGSQQNMQNYQLTNNIDNLNSQHISNQSNTTYDDGLFNILCDLPSTNVDVGSLADLMDEQTEELLDSLAADNIWNNEWNSSNPITTMMETT